MTLTAALNARMPETATVAALLVLGALVVRLTRLIVGLWVDAMPLPSLKKSSSQEDEALDAPLKRYAQRGLIGAGVNFAYMVLASLARLAAAAVRALITVCYVLLPLLMVALLLAIAQERWADAMHLLTSAFNGSIGSAMRWLLLAPLTVLDVAGRYVLPAWNLGVLLFVHMPVRFLSWMLSGSGAIQLVYALRTLAEAPPAFMHSASLFVSANAQTACAPEDFAAQACLSPQLRELDTVPAARLLQKASMHVVASLSGSCGVLALLLNATLYPVTDASLWYAADRLVNAVLAAVVVAPSTTGLRCALAGGMRVRPAMCTPDFAPAFALGADAALLLGQTLTQWIAAVYIWLQAQLTGTSPLDASSSLMMMPWQQGGHAAEGFLFFGHNATALVRLSEQAVALTDGYSVLWVSTAPRVSWSLAADAWPIPIDVSFGVARVRIGAAMYGLMGCMCSDNDGGALLQIQCAIVPFSGGGGGSSDNQTSAAWVLPAEFSLAAEAQLLTCDRVRVNVQSLRWPQARIAVQRLAPSLQGQSSSTSLITADAAVYVTPICGAQDGRHALACLPEASYTHGICFPYCLGLRFANGFRPLQLRGAAEWTQGVVLAGSDCSPPAAVMTGASAADGAEVASTTVCRVAADVAAPPSSLSALASSPTTTTADGGCGFAATCVSAIVDKATHPGYTQAHSAATTTAAAAAGSRLLLDGQPLAIGGGTQMRAFAADTGKTRFDFPTLVGNQQQEFTLESATPDGVPVSPNPPPTPSDQASTARLPTIDMPPLFVQSSLIPYNPGALARDALWYASNPSYAAFDAMLRYCASNGTDVALAIMFLSSYAPMRLQRVLTAQDSCFVNALLSNTQQCRDDLFTAQAFPDTLPVLTDSQVTATTVLYDLCVSGRQFNHYVEAIEYWDDANMAIAVRQGTVADLADGAGHGHTAYFFAQSADVTQIRADVPWPTSALGTSASSFDSVLFSSNHTSSSSSIMAAANLPDIGGCVGHSLAATIRAVGVVVNAFFNPFAITELLDARWAGVCPENALQHSALGNCGMALIDLDAVFVDIYAASHAFWDAVLWLANLVFPSSTPSIDILGRPMTGAMLRNFMQGLAVVGDASQVVGLFGATRWVSVFDTGAEKYLEQGAPQRRRRLLQEEGGGEGKKKEGGTSLLGHISGGFKKGIGGIASLSKFMLSVISSAPFAGADFSALFSQQSPHAHMIGATVSAPPVAFAEFTYKAVAPMLLDIIASVRAGKPSVASVWLHIGTTRDLFDDIIDQRMLQACGGVRLSVGYDSQLGQSMYWTCRASAAVAPAMLQLLTTLFADVALYRCLCVLPSGGADYLAYVQERCPAFIPPTRKAFWQVSSCRCAAESAPRPPRAHSARPPSQTPRPRRVGPTAGSRAARARRRPPASRRSPAPSRCTASAIPCTRARPSQATARC